MIKNLLDIKNLSKEDFHQIILYAQQLNSKSLPILKNKNIGLIFEKNSTRTRLSFQVGINQLQGNFIDIKLDDLNLKRFETFEDTFEIMACYLDALVYRTKDHDKLLIAEKFFKKPIINALSEVSHPCQAISDFFTLKEFFGSLDNLKIVWMGDINNVFKSIAECTRFLENTKIDVFTDEIIFKNSNKSNLKNLNINYHFSLNNKIIEEADCIMTDVYQSMNDVENKEKKLIRFQVNNEIMLKTKKECVFMHCLPAKIGSEVTQEVIKGEKSIVIKQARNRLVAQKGILKWLNI